MYRRALLLSLAGLSGCTGLVSNSPGGGETAGTSAPTNTPSANANGGDGTATPVESTPFDDGLPIEELRRMSTEELLSLAAEEVALALEAYEGEGADRTLRSINAASDSFDPSPVVNRLYRARRAYEEADRQGITAEQEAAIGQFRRLGTALRFFVDAQVYLIEAHDDLEQVALAIRYVDPDTAVSLTNRARDRQASAAGVEANLGLARYETSTSVVESLSREAYTRKRTQLGREIDVLGELTQGLTKVVEGVTFLSRARGAQRSGSPYAAADFGNDAFVAFDRGLRALRNVGASITTDSQGFAGLTTSLVTATSEVQAEAKALAESVEDDP